MKMALPGRRLTFLLGLLLLAVVMGVANAAHFAWLGHELRTVSEAEKVHLLKDDVFAPGLDTVTEVAIAKRWGVVGPALGKVTVYTRANGKDDGPSYGMLNLHYERLDSGWVQVESGYCAGNECVPAATRAFAAAE